MREAKSWLRVPAFGFLREHQEHYQKMAVALVEYQEQTSRYNALIMKASQRGFELFESKLAAREEPGRQIDSLRALYDLWVDAAEEAYAEIALSPEFREVYGELVNAQMRVRSQIQQEVERIATDFGMPTRSELDSIGQRLHDLRREVRNGSGNASGGALAREVETLRREVAALKAALNAKHERHGGASEDAAATARGAEPSAAAAKPVPRKRVRPPAARKRVPPVAALRADVKESVSTGPVMASPPRETKAAHRVRAPSRARPRTRNGPPRRRVRRRASPRSRTARRASAIRSRVSPSASRHSHARRASTSEHAAVDRKIAARRTLSHGTRQDRTA